MPRSILVVDDDADIRRALIFSLKSLGEVSGSSGGRAALRRIKARAPDLVLLDIAMPDLDGLSVLRAARMKHPNLVVVMLTGETDLDVAKQALELGARTYVTKPFDLDVVYVEVERLLEERTHRSAPPSGRPWRVASP
ncbi:MAG TPA: response regulator [Elusimicrobiota bacterium]|nr:response regulator [Elusimicrobiota bacterium]